MPPSPYIAPSMSPHVCESTTPPRDNFRTEGPIKDKI